MTEQQSSGPVVEHVALAVSFEHWSPTVSFYEELLGMQRFREIDGAYPIVYVGDGRGGAIELFAGEPPAVARPHLAFAVPLERFSGFYEQLAAVGAVLSAPAGNTPGTLAAFFEDPAGNHLQLVGRAAPLATRWHLSTPSG